MPVRLQAIYPIQCRHFHESLPHYLYILNGYAFGEHVTTTIMGGTVGFRVAAEDGGAGRGFGGGGVNAS